MGTPDILYRAIKSFASDMRWSDERKGSESASRRSEADNTKKAARKIKASLEKTTLGDITELQALKDEMEEKEAKSVGKKKK